MTKLQHGNAKHIHQVKTANEQAQEATKIDACLDFLRKTALCGYTPNKSIWWALTPLIDELIKQADQDTQQAMIGYFKELNG